jgi:hypothetical protein
MVISYDNLLTRLWLNGAIRAYLYQQSQSSLLLEDDLLGVVLVENVAMEKSKSDLETYITEKGLPPFWVELFTYSSNQW